MITSNYLLMTEGFSETVSNFKIIDNKLLNLVESKNFIFLSL